MTRSRRIYGAFNQGEIPRIACFNKATVPLGVHFNSLIAAMQEYVDRCVAPIWATPARLFKSTDFVKGAWAMVFLDDADAPGALAYHELTPEGLPISKVFVKTTIANGDPVSVSASHELVEMLIDPAINLMTTGPDPLAVYAYESADPVEALSFKVKGIPMSDFITPAYFEDFHKPGSVRFDYMNRVKRPFQILEGGYQIIFKNGKWTEKYANRSKEKAFSREDRRGHRSAARPTDKLQRADVTEIRAAEERASTLARLKRAAASRGLRDGRGRDRVLGFPLTRDRTAGEARRLRA